MKSMVVDRAKKKVCERKVVVKSTYSNPYSGHIDYYHKEHRVMCIAHECIYWEWDTDESGKCCRYEHEDFEELEQVRQVPRKVQDPDIPEWCPLEDEKEAERG
jgi:predicted ArsR family transcriptional regulator